MSRSLALVLAWLVAAGASLGVAWRGVAVVGEQVTEDRPAPLSAEELGAPGGSGGSSPTSSSTSSTTTTPSDGTEPVTETYTVTGGTVTLEFSPQGAIVLVATPNSGFEVETEPEHGNGVQVDFESESHRSRVVGWWDGGPRHETREDPDRSD